VQHDEELLALNVIVEHHLVAWLELIEAGAEMLGAGDLGNPGGGNPVCTGGRGIIEIAHTGRVRGSRPSEPSRPLGCGWSGELMDRALLALRGPGPNGSVWREGDCGWRIMLTA
jgi:hypothetical protein